MPQPTLLRVTLDDDRTYEIEVREEGGRTVARVNGRDMVVELREGAGIGGLVDGRPMELGAPAGDLSTVFVPGGRPLRVGFSDGVSSLSAPRVEALRAGEASRAVMSPITGIVSAVLVQPGDLVAQGQPLLLVEAMKMENRIQAPATGRVVRIDVAQGALVRPGQILAHIEAAESH